MGKKYKNVNKNFSKIGMPLLSRLVWLDLSISAFDIYGTKPVIQISLFSFRSRAGKCTSARCTTSTTSSRKREVSWCSTKSKSSTCCQTTTCTTASSCTTTTTSSCTTTTAACTANGSYECWWKWRCSATTS